MCARPLGGSIRGAWDVDLGFALLMVFVCAGGEGGASVLTLQVSVEGLGFGCTSIRFLPLLSWVGFPANQPLATCCACIFMSILISRREREGGGSEPGRVGASAPGARVGEVSRVFFWGGASGIFDFFWREHWVALWSTNKTASLAPGVQFQVQREGGWNIQNRGGLGNGRFRDAPVCAKGTFCRA